MDMAGSKIVSNIKYKQSQKYYTTDKMLLQLGLFQSLLQQKSDQNSDSNARITYIVLQETLWWAKKDVLLACKIREK